MYIKERDLKVIKLIDKFRILSINQIMVFCDFPYYKSASRRMNDLYKNGYVNKYRQDIYNPYIYFLTQKGTNLIYDPIYVSKTKKYHYKKPSKIVYNRINHELLIADICFQIIKNNDITLNEIELDREIRSKQWRKDNRHIPDIRIEKFKIVVEVELNKKPNKDINRNIKDNSYYYQLWIVPEKKKTLYDFIKNNVQKNTIIEALYLNDLKDYNFQLKDKFNILMNENEELLERLQKIKELEEKQLQLKID